MYVKSYSFMIGLSKGPTQTLNLSTIYLKLFLNNIKLIYYYYDLNHIQWECLLASA